MSIPSTTHRWEWLHKSKIFKDNWIILIRLRFLVIFSDFTWLQPLTHPSNHSPTYGWRSLHGIQIFKQKWIISIDSRPIELLLIPQIIILQTEFSYLDKMMIYSIFNNLTWTNPLTHPYTYPKVRSLSTNHKSSNRTELSCLDQVLLNFLWFHMILPINPPIHQPTHQIKQPPIN